MADMFTYAPAEPVEGVVVMLSLFEGTGTMQEAFLERVATWLEPGGMVLVCVFCTDDLGGYAMEWDGDGRGPVVKGFRFMGKVVGFHVFSRAGWVRTLEEAGLVKVTAELETFVPPEDVQGDSGPDYFILARNPQGQ